MEWHIHRRLTKGQKGIQRIEGLFETLQKGPMQEVKHSDIVPWDGGRYHIALKRGAPWCV